MNVFQALGKFLLTVGGLVKKALTAALGSGLTDELIADALKAVRSAAVKFSDNAEKREWAVKQLVKVKVPESIARLAVELAYQLFKKELDEAIPPTV